MKPHIQHTSFGSITIDNQTYNHDVLIRSNGEIEKRKKRLSKNVYGTSHIVSLDEAKFISEDGIQKIIIGCGQYGALSLSDEAREFFNNKHVQVKLAESPQAINEFNNTREPCVGLFHVTC